MFPTNRFPLRFAPKGAIARPLASIAFPCMTSAGARPAVPVS